MPMSLNESDNSRRPVPHWAVIVPLEVGLASSEHAATTFATLQAKYMNQWGLKHTVGDDERVWTLPTATLSRAAYRYGQAELGFQMLQQLSATLDHGSIGMYHELIPDGLSFLQLWSGSDLLARSGGGFDGGAGTRRSARGQAGPTIACRVGDGRVGKAELRRAHDYRARDPHRPERDSPFRPGPADRHLPGPGRKRTVSGGRGGQKRAIVKILHIRILAGFGRFGISFISILTNSIYVL